MQEREAQQEPRATITYLYTDIEGSTRLWEHMPVAMQRSQDQHHSILHEAIARHGGTVFQIRGDAFCATFWTALDGVLAALDAQRALAAATWNETGPIKVRMVVHTGVTDRHAGLHDGPFLNRVGRLLAATYGGQVLIGASTQTLVQDLLPDGVSLRDLGEHSLRDVVRPERIFQLVAPDLPADFPPLLTALQAPLHLPENLTRFIGREYELDQLMALLATTRLLTLVGPGGTGKTRLAVQLAAQQAANYPAGVWFVEFAPLSDEELVVQAIAATLGVREQAGQALLSTVIEYLRGKRLLILLDNCEHLVGTCARVVDRMLRECPALVILVTSREALGIAGEVLFPVPALALPTPQDLQDLIERPTSALQYDSVRLFVERARAVRPDFVLADQNVAAVVEICRRLDGIPLALELAAARMKLLSVGQIAERLSDAFRLLTVGSRTALPRQQTLRASIDWSYQLLPAQERAIFARLAVFAGGWLLEAAEQVCSGAGIEADAVLDILQELVEKSLVVAEEQEEQARYRMLTIIRQYANEKLQQTTVAEQELVRRCHLQWCLALAEAAEPYLESPEQVQWFKRLDEDLDNLRSALEWAEDHDPETGLRLVVVLRYYWLVRGYWTEGKTWLLRMLEVTPHLPTHDRATALDFAGFFTSVQGDLAIGQQLSEESLALYRKLDDRHGIASVLVNLANIARRERDYTNAQTMFEESLALRQAIGDKNEIGHGLVNLATLFFIWGDGARANEYGEKGLAMYRAAGNYWGMTHALMTLGLNAVKTGDVEHGQKYLHEGLVITRSMGVGAIATAPALLLGLAVAARGTAQWERAARLLGAAQSGIKLMNISEEFNYESFLDEAIPLLREKLGAEVFTTLWSEGYSIGLEQAISYALEDTSR